MKKEATAINLLKGIGPQRAKMLEKLGIFTVEDLLYHFPRRYEDRSKVTTIAEMHVNETVVISVRINRVQEQKIRKGLSVLKAEINDDSGKASAVWFNQSHLKKRLVPGSKTFIIGKAKSKAGIKEIIVEDYELIINNEKLFSGGIVPFYPTIKGLNQKFWRQVQKRALSLYDPEKDEVFSLKEREQYKLLDLKKALQEIHFPTTFQDLEQARYRLAFEELYLLQLALEGMRKFSYTNGQGIVCVTQNALPNKFVKNLPFALTKAQERVIADISKDMESDKPMKRLIQGDVGSGKTVVAAWALLKAVEGGYQGVMMAPTEILAQQHFLSLQHWFDALGIQIMVLTGRQSLKEKENISEQVKKHKCQVVIGTHALLQENVVFANLGLIVIDEQHRFGVGQRTELKQKGENPGVLVMSATPIPRTLALTMYGNVDVSFLDEMPPGRKPVITYCLFETARTKLWKYLRQHLQKKAKIFVVCPLVEEGKKADVQNAADLALKLTEELFPYKIGLLHGRMQPQEKEEVLLKFREGDIQLLVTTTVIEVGVDIPQATVMVVENAEYFGLAQLHQLRGRVGRGEEQAYCILMTASSDPVSLKRLKLFTKITDGFQLAEEDLKLRGPGEFLGFKQHGLPELRLADLLRDQELLSRSRQLREELLKIDPDFFQPEHQNLARKLEKIGNK